MNALDESSYCPKLQETDLSCEVSSPLKTTSHCLSTRVQTKPTDLKYLESWEIVVCSWDLL